MRKDVLPIQENEHAKGGAELQVGFDASLEGKMFDAMSCLLCICRESQWRWQCNIFQVSCV